MARVSFRNSMASQKAQKVMICLLSKPGELTWKSIGVRFTPKSGRRIMSQACVRGR